MSVSSGARLGQHEVIGPLGSGGMGSFSPDGTQIAFSSTGDKGDNVDIWLKIVGEDAARRITSDPAVDQGPAWSPDGRWIAFIRATSSDPFAGGAIYLVSPLGGPERRLLEFPASQVSWSPDGRTLAYAACEDTDGGVGACVIHVQPLDDQLRPRGEARRLTHQGRWNAGVAWTRDGRWIVYAVNEVSSPSLWRVRADASGAPERVELAGRGAMGPATARGWSRSRAILPTTSFRAGRATAAGCASARIAPAVSRSGVPRPRGWRQSS